MEDREIEISAYYLFRNWKLQIKVVPWLSHITCFTITLLWNLALLFFCYHYQLWFHELLKLFTCTFWPAYGNDTLEELVEDSSASMPWLQYWGGSLCSNRCMPKLLVTVVCNRVAPLWRQMPSFIDGFRMMARWKKLWVDGTFSVSSVISFLFVKKTFDLLLYFNGFEPIKKLRTLFADGASSFN